LTRIIFLIFLLTSFLSAKSITIAVAANVSYAIESLKKEFMSTFPKTEVRVVIGSSGKLTAQIKHGAEYDIFMSADMSYPNSLFKDKKTISKPVVYAKGSLAILSLKKRNFTNVLELLQSRGIKNIAVANPKTAPYGKATNEALTNAKVYEKISKKFVYGESIGQTLSYVISAADIGFVALSSLYSEKLNYLVEGENWVGVDKSLYTPIEQGMVMLREDEEVKAFYEFVLSERGREIFKSFGYVLDL